MKLKHWIGAAVALGTVAIVAPAQATTIDFSGYTPDTPVSRVGDVAFSLSGGPSNATTPVATNIAYGGGEVALANSDTNNYPTTEKLTATFDTLASNISFTFDDYGLGNGAFYDAFGATGNLVSTGSLDGLTYATPVSVAGTGIKSLVFDNGFGSDGDWIFGVQTLSYTAAAAVSAAPEPGSWMMMILGFGLIGGVMRSAYRTSEDRFTDRVRAIAAA